MLPLNLGVILDYSPVLLGLAKSCIWPTLSEAPVQIVGCFGVCNIMAEVFQDRQLSSWPGHERNEVIPQSHLRVFPQ